MVIVCGFELWLVNCVVFNLFIVFGVFVVCLIVIYMLDLITVFALVWLLA